MTTVVYNGEHWEVLNQERENHLVDLKQSVPDFKLYLKNTSNGRIKTVRISEVHFNYEW